MLDIPPGTVVNYPVNKYNSKLNKTCRQAG